MGVANYYVGCIVLLIHSLPMHVCHINDVNQEHPDVNELMASVQDASNMVALQPLETLLVEARSSEVNGFMVAKRRELHK